MKKIVLAFLAMLMLVSLSFAATIGFIDTEQVFNGYALTKTAKEDVNNRMKEYKKIVAKYQQKIDNAKIDGKTDEDIEKIKEEMKKEIEPKEKEIQEFNNEKIAKIRKNIVVAVDAVARELGIDVVVDKQVIITGGTDITDQVVYKLNKSVK